MWDGLGQIWQSDTPSGRGLRWDRPCLQRGIWELLSHSAGRPSAQQGAPWGQPSAAQLLWGAWIETQHWWRNQPHPSSRSLTKYSMLFQAQFCFGLYPSLSFSAAKSRFQVPPFDTRLMEALTGHGFSLLEFSLTNCLQLPSRVGGHHNKMQC